MKATVSISDIRNSVELFYEARRLGRDCHKNHKRHDLPRWAETLSEGQGKAAFLFALAGLTDAYEKGLAIEAASKPPPVTPSPAPANVVPLATFRLQVVAA